MTLWFISVGIYFSVYLIFSQASDASISKVNKPSNNDFGFGGYLLLRFEYVYIIIKIKHLKS